MELSDTQQEIYSRQLMMKEIGEKGQEKLAGASVLVAGCGGLGASALYYLTAAGIGHLGLCDNDTVSLSNLNRQILFTAHDVGSFKTSAAKKRLVALNPQLKVSLYNEMIEELDNSVLKSYDIIVDCLDNFKARFYLNDACVTAGIPFIHAGVGEFYGQLMNIIPGKSPCLRCFFPNGLPNGFPNGLLNGHESVKIPDTPKQKKDAGPIPGIIGPIPGIIGSMQALEAIKYLLGMQIYTSGLITLDGLSLTFEKVPVTQVKTCFCNNLQ